MPAAQPARPPMPTDQPGEGLMWQWSDAVGRWVPVPDTNAAAYRNNVPTPTVGRTDTPNAPLAAGMRWQHNGYATGPSGIETDQGWSQVPANMTTDQWIAWQKQRDGQQTYVHTKGGPTAGALETHAAYSFQPTPTLPVIPEKTKVTEPYTGNVAVPETSAKTAQPWMPDSWKTRPGRDVAGQRRAWNPLSWSSKKKRV